jgi:hypothetical protein
MATIYISETGNDANDGLSPETAIRSCRRALMLSRGDTRLHLMGVRTLERLSKEIEEKKRHEIYSKSEWG